MAGELILIVEDNERNRKLVRDVLQFKDYRTVEADNAEEGIRLAAESAPALILMDIQLPGMNGIQALERLRADARTRAMPVVAVTASAMTDERERIRAAGFDGYLRKPLDIHEFLETVGRLLEKNPPPA